MGFEPTTRSFGDYWLTIRPHLFTIYLLMKVYQTLISLSNQDLCCDPNRTQVYHVHPHTSNHHTSEATEDDDIHEDTSCIHLLLENPYSHPNRKTNEPQLLQRGPFVIRERRCNQRLRSRDIGREGQMPVAGKLVISLHVNIVPHFIL